MKRLTKTWINHQRKRASGAESVTIPVDALIHLLNAYEKHSLNKCRYGVTHSCSESLCKLDQLPCDLYISKKAKK